MNALIVLRIILVVVLIVSVDFIIKLNRTFKIDKRVSRYSIDSIIAFTFSISIYIPAFP